MKYLEQWAAGLISSRSGPPVLAVRVEGIRKAHFGPRFEIARIELMIEPAEAFEVIVSMPELVPSIESDQFIDWAIFGFLDVAMTTEPFPVKDMRITVVGIEIDPVSSSMMAFRHAGRDAGRRFLGLRSGKS
jgi:hypothetical protein